MFSSIVELMIYSAAMDVYRSFNRGEIYLSEKETIALLKIVDYQNRPAILKGEGE